MNITIKHNCATCIHGFQFGWESYCEWHFSCWLDGSHCSAQYFRDNIKICKNWLRRTSRNEKKFNGAFYMSAGAKYMDEQWIKIGKEYRWL